MDADALAHCIARSSAAWNSLCWIKVFHWGKWPSCPHTILVMWNKSISSRKMTTMPTHHFSLVKPRYLNNYLSSGKIPFIKITRSHDHFMNMHHGMTILETHEVSNPLRPSDTIWWQWSGSTLAQVMACCLMAPSHYLNQCWLIISEVQWHSY